MELNSISEEVIGAAIEVHRRLGPGLLESAYEQCMAVEMADRGLEYQQQLLLPLVYKGVPVEGGGYRIDFLVQKEVVVELKAVSRVEDVHRAQVLTYLKLTGCKLGLLLNFNVPVLRLGIHRIANGCPDHPPRL